MPRPIWVVALAALAGRVEAQTPAVLAPGVRVRVDWTGPSGYLDQRTEGTIKRIAGDTLVVQGRVGAATPVYVGHPETRLFLFSGRRSSAIRGLAIGGVLGIVAGGAVSLVVGKSCIIQRGLCLHRRQFALGGGILFALTGATTGLVVGSLSRRDRWTQTGPPSGRLQVREIPPPDFSLGVRIRF